MQTRNRGDFTIAGCELVAEGADLRVQVLSLASGSAYRGITTARSATVLFVWKGQWWSRRERRATSIGYRRASAARCRLRRRITCMARPMARASFSSYRGLAYTTSCRSADEANRAGLPHVQGRKGAPTCGKCRSSGRGCADYGIEYRGAQTPRVQLMPTW